MKIAHIADVHIRNLKYHDVYRDVFEKLYASLSSNCVELIVVCGDIAHTKTQISPEFVQLASEFFGNLSEIAPTVVILGNHDGNLKNSSRQDAITPVIDNMKEHRFPLTLMKKSGEINFDEVVLNHISIFDRENRILEPTSPKKINIALYHGLISGVETDMGAVLTGGDDSINIFRNFDFAMLGDIHKTNQILDTEGKVRYPGSLIQQNFGETNDKGYLLWDIKNKEDFTCEHVKLKSLKPFISINLLPNGRLPKNLSVDLNSRIRLLTEKNLSLDIIRRTIDVVKTKFSPESVSFVNRATNDKFKIDVSGGQEIKDLRDLSVQEDLINKFLNLYELELPVKEKVISLNSEINSEIAESFELARNVKWKLKEIKWSNLFNYGDLNSINFDNLGGIIGIFGKNYSGKSSVVDSFLYTMYNSISKNVRKNYNIINQHRDVGSGEVLIEVDDELFFIKRSSEKYVKKLAGAETLEARTAIDFQKFNMSDKTTTILNGICRNDTEKNIRNIFGTLDDFLMTSMMAQFGSFNFIELKSTGRKNILAKFLDLDFFEKKFLVANERSSEIKAKLKILESKNYDLEISNLKKKLINNLKDSNLQKEKCESLEEEIGSLVNNINQLKNEISIIPNEVIDYKEVTKKMKSYSQELLEISSAIETSKIEMTAAEELLKLAEEYIEGFESSGETIKALIQIKKYEKEIEEWDSLIKSQNDKIKLVIKKTEYLETAPCSENYDSCRLVEEARLSLKALASNETTLRTLLSERKQLVEKRDAMTPEKVEALYEAYENHRGQKDILLKRISEHQLTIARGETNVAKISGVITQLQTMKDTYESYSDIIENKESLLRELEIKEETLKDKRKVYGKQKDILMEFYKTHGFIEQKNENLLQEKDLLEETRTEYAAYDLYKKCMHSNGIPFDIIREKLPIINDEISKILANVVEFEVRFVSDDKRLDIFIKHPKHEPRPIEMASGAEKTIAGVAIRLALLSISSLPKGDIFILDEPGANLDEINMEGFICILDMIKTYFKNVILISHLDTLKDIVDTQIVIEKKDGFAYINM